jgi:hypothetical protein
MQMYDKVKNIFGSILLIFLSISSLYSADTLNIPRSKLYFDNLHINNIWLNSANPASLGFINRLSRISCAEAGYSYTDKGLKFPIEPGTINSYFARTGGYKKVGKLTFYGSFAYENEHYDKYKYNNTLIFDPDIPYILGDTIEGKQYKEGFLLKGSLSYPVTKNLMAGIMADYRNYVGAKLIDPRNKNDISYLAVTPGIIYNPGKLSFGLSGGPIIFNNEISIDVVETGRNYNLFQFMGMGYYKSIKNITSYTNGYFGKGYTAEVQFNYAGNLTSNLLTLNFTSTKEEVRHDNSERLIDGITNKMIVKLNDYMIIRRSDNIHQINISLSMNQVSGTEVMQHFRSIVAGQYKYDTLITDSWTDDKQIGITYDATIGYTYSGYTGSVERFRFNAGISATYKSIDHYPVQNYGSVSVMNIIPEAGAKYFLRFGAISIVPGIGIDYRKNLMSEMSYIVTDQCLAEFEQLDYNARNSDFIKGKASLMILRKVKMKYISEYFMNLDSELSSYTDKGNNTYHNIFFKASVGLIF